MQGGSDFCMILRHRCLVTLNAFDVGCPGLRQVHKVGSAKKKCDIQVLLEGLERLHGPSHV